MVAGDPNWFIDASAWLPIETLSPDYAGPVVFTDETKTIHWFDAKATGKKTAVDHKEHERDDQGAFLFDGDKPRMKSRKLKPAFWAMARIAD